MKFFFDVAAMGAGESAVFTYRLCTCYLAQIRGSGDPEEAGQPSSWQARAAACSSAGSGDSAYSRRHASVSLMA